MLKNFYLSFALSLLGSAASAEINFDKPGSPGLGAELAVFDSPVRAALPQPEGGRPQAAPAEWTIMVFMNGKNDLEYFAVEDLNEMESVGSTARINIVVEAGRMDGYDNSDGNWKGTRRYFITRDTDTAHVSSAVVENLGKVDMGDYKNLAAFGRWAKEKYPAKKYMLIVWNHGSGWKKSVKSSAKGISYDAETGNHINTPQLGLALKEIGKVDVYGSDACLMQMAEVGYEIKDYADYIVGSEETEGSDGYPYDTFLAPLAARPEMTSVELARQAVDAYSAYYKQRGPATQSVIKASALPGLVARVNAWTGAVMAAGLKSAVHTARGDAMTYAMLANKDLYHFTTLVSYFTTNNAVKKATEALQTYIEGDLVVYNRYVRQEYPSGGWDYPADNGQNYANSHGLAVYVPGSQAVGEGYNELAWAAASNWDEFLAWQLQP